MTTTSGRRSRRLRSLAEALGRKLIVPTPRLAGLVAGGAALVAAGYALGAGTGVLLLVNAVLLGASVVDVSLLPRRRSLTVLRDLPERADRGEPFNVRIRVEARRVGSVALRLTAQDDLPGSFTGHGQPLPLTWQGQRGEVTYTTAGTERGDYLFSRISLRLGGPLGLWIKPLQAEVAHTLRIYPDMSAVRGILGSLPQHMTLEGKRLYRRDTAGSEFHSIRDYVDGDDPRRINWRATARAGSPMSDVVRPERGKVVMLLLDCGRTMGMELSGRNKLDVALEALLALAAVALKQGDKVGFIAYSSEIKRHVPPGAGIRQLAAITDAAYNLSSDFVEASRVHALDYLLRTERKRSLIVLFSDIHPDLQETQFLPMLSRLKRQHYLLLLGMRDETVHELALARSRTVSEAYAKSLAHKSLLDRQAYTAAMAAAGIAAIDVAVNELAWTAVNRYLQIKARDAL